MRIHDRPDPFMWGDSKQLQRQINPNWRPYNEKTNIMDNRQTPAKDENNSEGETPGSGGTDKTD